MGIRVRENGGAVAMGGRVWEIGGPVVMGVRVWDNGGSVVVWFRKLRIPSRTGQCADHAFHPGNLGDLVYLDV